MLIEGKVKQSFVETSCPIQSDFVHSVRSTWSKGQELLLLCGPSDYSDGIQCVSLFQLMMMCKSDTHHSDTMPEDIILKEGKPGS